MPFSPKTNLVARESTRDGPDNDEDDVDTQSASGQMSRRKAKMHNTLSVTGPTMDLSLVVPIHVFLSVRIDYEDLISVVRLTLYKQIWTYLSNDACIF